LRRQSIRFLARDDRGAALVEFTIILPVLLALFVLLTEGGRVMWYHQLVSKSVRDATRYLTRVATAEQLCPTTGGVNLVPAGYLANARNLAMRGSLDPSQPFLNAIWTDLTTLQARVDCITNGGAYRGASRIPLITVTATVPVDFASARLLTMTGSTPQTLLTFEITDQARHYGE
jgi:Flp pilus assembly protein TadG